MPEFKHNVHVFHRSAREWASREALPRDINARLKRNEHIVSVNYADGEWWVFTETFGLDLDTANKP